MDTRRMNVAMTRAKTSLFLLGNALTLERSDEVWAKIVQDARDRHHLMIIELSKTGGKLPVSLTTSIPEVQSIVSSPVKAAPKVPPSAAASHSSAVPIMKPKELKKSISVRIPAPGLTKGAEPTPNTPSTDVQPLKTASPSLKRPASGDLEPRPPIPISTSLKRSASDDFVPRPPPPPPGTNSSGAGTSSTSMQPHLEPQARPNPPPRRPKPPPSLFIPKKRP